MLCQDAWSAPYEPVTGSPAVVTATFRSVPPAAVTAMPCAGSAPRALFPGVIVTTGPVGVGFAEGDADAAPGAADDAAATGCTEVVPEDPVQAVTVNASAAPAATAETPRIALMSTRYLTQGNRARAAPSIRT